MREAHRNFRATMQKRQKIVPRVCSIALGAPNALSHCFGVVQRRLGTAPGAFCSWVPKTVLSAPRRVSETARGAQNRPKSIWHRFFTDLGSILGSIFDGFCVEFLFAWPFVCLLLRSSARSTVAVHLRFSCVLRAYEPHRQSTIPT